MLHLVTEEVLATSQPGPAAATAATQSCTSHSRGESALSLPVYSSGSLSSCNERIIISQGTWSSRHCAAHLNAACIADAPFTTTPDGYRRHRRFFYAVQAPQLLGARTLRRTLSASHCRSGCLHKPFRRSGARQRSSPLTPLTLPVFATDGSSSSSWHRLLASMAPQLRPRNGGSTAASEPPATNGDYSSTDSGDMLTADAVDAAEPQDPKALRAAKRAARAQVCGTFTAHSCPCDSTARAPLEPDSTGGITEGPQWARQVGKQKDHNVLAMWSC